MTVSALDQALGRIRDQFGENTVIRLGDSTAIEAEVVPTGALTLDLALGIGGLPRGRLVELFGPDAAGKTTLLYHLIANAQAMGGKAAFVDAEHALDPPYAGKIGVDTDGLYVCQPDWGEMGLEVVAQLAGSGEFALIVVDSVAALVPKVELEGAMGDQTVGLHARMMSQGMRKLGGVAGRTNTLVVFTNQIREKIGVIYGSPEVQPGGRALKFYASQRLDIRRIESLKDGDEVYGQRVRVKVLKNKMAAPHRQAEFDIEYGKGISREGCLLDVGVERGVVTLSGSWYRFGDGKRANGKPAAKELLRGDPGLRDAIEAEVRS